MTAKRQRVWFGVGLVLLALAVIFAAGPRVRIGPRRDAATSLPSDLDPWLQQAEQAVPALRPDLRKTIRWADPAARSRTPVALIYLHGFSASPREVSPVVEEVGAALRANVFFTRLRGHGQDAEAMATARAEDWLDDADEALAIGRRLGDRVVVIGMSTGGTLATWLASRNPDLLALILLSPNFGLKDPGSRILLWPWGLQMARLVIGDYRSFQPANELQRRNWTTRYRIEALLPMMAMVEMVDKLDLTGMHIPTLVLYSEADEVLDTRRVVQRFGQIGAARKQLIAVPGTTHVLAGDAVNPGATPIVEQHILHFLHDLTQGSR